MIEKKASGPQREYLAAIRPLCLIKVDIVADADPNVILRSHLLHCGRNHSHPGNIAMIPKKASGPQHEYVAAIRALCQIKVDIVAQADPNVTLRSHLLH